MIEGRFRFDNFVVGASNRLAVSAARAVAESPGAVYNPLFVYSASGLGKTHLLGAVGHAARALRPELNVTYLPLEEFVEQLHQAVAQGQPESFKHRLQSVDLLLLDDVQFLTGQGETQAEMLRLFNALQHAGRQIVMASDRAPTEITDVDQRLLTRMAGGLIVDIGEPEYEMRLAILRSHCTERGLSFAPGVLEELARVPSHNVRELQGALNRLVAQQAIAGEPLTVEDAHDTAVATRGAAAAPPDEFDNFLSEVAAAVSQSVEQWRIRLGEAVARWSGEGFRTDLLARHLEDIDAPDLESLEAQFVALVNRLRSLESEAARLDARLAGMPVFRDPERVGEAETIVLRALAAYDPPPGPNRYLGFDSFVSGSRNQLALRAAGEVTALPGTRYNPLFLHGPAGAGKTHLAHAIGNALAARDGGSWTVACLSADGFAEELVTAMQDGEMDRWRMRYRSVDAFILDNVHLLAGKERTQDELFHLFNQLHESGKQVVFTSEVPPAHLVDAAARLRSRFEGGLVVEIGFVPEAERVARHTPVPDGAEAAAPTIDAWFDEIPSGEEAAARAFIGGITDVDSFFLDPEKVITEWPGFDGRVVEDLR